MKKQRLTLKKLRKLKKRKSLRKRQIRQKQTQKAAGGGFFGLNDEEKKRKMAIHDEILEKYTEYKDLKRQNDSNYNTILHRHGYDIETTEKQGFENFYKISEQITIQQNNLQKEINELLVQYIALGGKEKDFPTEIRQMNTSKSLN